MPSQPMAIWKTPCSSRKVQSAGISTRRHTIGLTSLSQSFSCRMEPDGSGEDARARFAKGQSRWGPAHQFTGVCGPSLFQRPTLPHALVILAGSRVFCDETPMPVLDPGRGQTKRGQFWSHAVDDRPWGGPAPPAVAYV